MRYFSFSDVPNFSDPHIPVVAREILQRMIRQFAAEYTSKTSPSQDSRSDIRPHSDQSLVSPPLPSRDPPSTSPASTVTGPAHNQNPVLSKLLMADQDAPLDLTIKKHPVVPHGQDGVLDLSIKKNRSSSSQPVKSPCFSLATSALKGESPDLCISKAKDLQSTSTLEQFMAKLCPQHQRRIVDAIGFLQAEVKALSSSNTQQGSNSSAVIQTTSSSAPKSSAVTPDKPYSELRFTPLKSEVHNIAHSFPKNCAIHKVTENAVSLKTSVAAGPTLDHHQPGSGNNQTLFNLSMDSVDADKNRQGDHAPLKMKIMASNVADGKKLSCVLNASLSSHSDTLEDREQNSNSSNRIETHSARLSSSVKRHSQASHIHQAKQRETLRHSKDTPAKPVSVHMAFPSDSPRTAKKTTRASSDHRIRDCAGLADPDLGHCDIVFIDKPITECFKKRQRSILPRRNARKSTRGHMYSDEIWELKTVRTLAGRGNCANPMPELTTLVTPKQMLSKPDGVPPVDMPFAGACRESINQQMSTEESDKTVIPGAGDTVELVASEADVIVETSQTDQCQIKSVPPSPIRSPTQNKETDINTGVEQDADVALGIATGTEEKAAPVPVEAEKENNQPQPQGDICENIEQIVTETLVDQLKNTAAEEVKPLVLSDKPLNRDSTLQMNSAPSPQNEVEEEREQNKMEEIQIVQPQELQPQTLMHHDNVEVAETNTTSIAEQKVTIEPEIKTTEAVENLVPLGTEDDNDTYDVSSKTLDALLKELPPWRRKKGTVISLPKRLRQTETVVVGYVNGRPISASDRSLRRRSSNNIASPFKITVESNQNVTSKTVKDSVVHSNLENETLEKQCIESPKPTESFETAPEIQQVKDLSSVTPSSSTSPFSSRTKQIQVKKSVQRAQDSLLAISHEMGESPPGTDSKRHLRSACQRPSETPISSSTSDGVTSISSSEAMDTHASPSTEHTPSLLPSLLTDTSPPVMSTLPAATEQSQQDTVPETIVDFNTEIAQNQAETTSKGIQQSECEQLQTKQKLRSAKAVADDSKDEKQLLSMEISSPIKSLVKTEVQTQNMPLRSKRVLRKDAETNDITLLQKQNVATLSQDLSTSGEDNSSSITDKPTRMPLRSESSKPEMSHQSFTQSPLTENKKLALRSQRLVANTTVDKKQNELTSPVRVKPERSKAQVRPSPPSVASVFSPSSAIPVFTQRPEPPKQANKFLQTLTADENQHLITNLNIRYDKMQKGWVQMDKEGQPPAKYKNRADRQAAIWKSKRRARKAKSLEHHKYSPVQMLFMKSFSLTSICRWFLESTETKSLVIVKKVNTRLPSETQLCFHSSSGTSGTSQGVFPSIQAERLKKHLKKFAIASPVKSNPKSQKLIAKALEQEASVVKGKEGRQPQSIRQSLVKSHSSKAAVQISESQKTCGKSKNPASARILRKYSHIREKLQVQQTNVRLKKASTKLRTNSLKKLTTTKSTAKSNFRSPLKAQNSLLPVNKQIKGSVKTDRRKSLTGKKTEKHLLEKAVKAQSSNRTSRDATKKELPKRCSQRLGSPKISEHKPVSASKSKVDSKKQMEAENVEVEKPPVNKGNAAKIQTKEVSQTITGSESAAESPQPRVDVRASTSPDQVLTRSQRKMETAVPLNGSPSRVSKTATKSARTQTASSKSVRKAEEPALTRSGSIKSPVKRSQADSFPRSANKRPEEPLETPAKRTRTSVSK
ncbi:uncharacterized protein wu:fc17b08 isoform X2 [Antennarius striatus]|uniref:uncharacterized protein wu:fc17b08 isoform X2 n=1 Tax=Antennarius striatus TaxID=241820 RepID=UPI0035B4ADCA